MKAFSARLRGMVALGLPAQSRSFRRRQCPTTIFVVARTFGNALHQLQAFVQPHVKHVITQTFEQADEEFQGDKSDTAVHLLRQAIQIQRGDEVDQVSALLPKRRLEMRE
jgi:hypothetical protein